MPENISLEELVLGYCKQVDGVVEPPAFNAYEILLPDEVAAQWGITPHQRFAFAPEVENAAYIHYGHNLVESIVDDLRTKIANGRFFINNVRPEKPKLYEVIEKAIALPNAKMFALRGEQEQVKQHHYVRLNFKVSLIADEKRELILPLWMDLQNGYVVKAAEIERMAIFDQENEHANAAPAALYWSKEAPLALGALNGLMERARLLAAVELGDTLAVLQKRLLRFLELDRARLNDYYDDLRKDSERRLQKAEDERRPALESKLTAIANERLSKLADVEQKYHLRIQLELVNLAIISQPKLDLEVEIRKRNVSIRRRATWDPLLHVVEGLVCDACGQAGTTLSLCENGHLAHAECLTAQCVECKRTFCQKCAHEMQSCVVCERAVCVHSLQRCKDCGRGTCQEHAGECHANAGEPRRVAAAPIASNETAAKAEQNERARPAASASTGKSSKAKPDPKRSAPKGRTLIEKPQPEVVGDYLEVFSDPAQNLISAYIMLKKREIATREWSMSEEGIAVNCFCKKANCREKNLVYRPASPALIAKQVTGFVEAFAGEYGIPVKKIHFFQVRQNEPHGETHLKLPSTWKDPVTLERAVAGFEALSERNRNRR